MMPDYGNLEDWRKAGKLAAEVLDFGKSLIKKGAKMLEVSDKIDAKIYELGGKPAFPSQISCDHIAAHYCAHPDDDIVFDEQLCCLDVGVHVDGAIGDNATSVDLSGKNPELVKASREALDAAIKVVAPGITLGEVGRAIHEVITSYGFAPVRNLSGHGLGRYEIHTSPSVPNYDNHDPTELEEGQIIAIEPFATKGKGMIFESEPSTIYSLIQKKPVRSPAAREVLKNIEQYDSLPFTTRWLTKNMPLFKVKFGLRELVQNGVLREHPPLPDADKGLVSQAEHTIMVKDKPEILTKL